MGPLAYLSCAVTRLEAIPMVACAIIAKSQHGYVVKMTKSWQLRSGLMSQLLNHDVLSSSGLVYRTSQVLLSGLPYRQGSGGLWGKKLGSSFVFYLVPLYSNACVS